MAGKALEKEPHLLLFEVNLRTSHRQAEMRPSPRPTVRRLPLPLATLISKLANNSEQAQPPPQVSPWSVSRRPLQEGLLGSALHPEAWMQTGQR